MRKQILNLVLALALFAPVALAAGPKDEFEAAYTEAVATHEKARGHQWTVTSAALEAAETAAKDGAFDKALALAHEAQELAEASVAQRESQEQVWRKAVVR